MDISYQEKSILGSLVITVALFSYFFAAVVDALQGAAGAVEELPFVLIGVVLAVIAVEAVYHIVIALLEKPADEDERDRLIDARATRISYFVMVAVNLTIVGHSLFWSVFGNGRADNAAQSPVIIASLVICSFIVAEIVGFAVQLYYYRRGF